MAATLILDLDSRTLHAAVREAPGLLRPCALRLNDLISTFLPTEIHLDSARYRNLDDGFLAQINEVLATEPSSIFMPWPLLGWLRPWESPKGSIVIRSPLDAFSQPGMAQFADETVRGLVLRLLGFILAPVMEALRSTDRNPGDLSVLALTPEHLTREAGTLLKLALKKAGFARVRLLPQALALAAHSWSEGGHQRTAVAQTSREGITFSSVEVRESRHLLEIDLLRSATRQGLGWPMLIKAMLPGETAGAEAQTLAQNQCDNELHALLTCPRSPGVSRNGTRIGTYGQLRDRMRGDLGESLARMITQGLRDQAAPGDQDTGGFVASGLMCMVPGAEEALLSGIGNLGHGRVSKDALPLERAARGASALLDWLDAHPERTVRASRRCALSLDSGHGPAPRLMSPAALRALPPEPVRIERSLTIRPGKDVSSLFLTLRFGPDDTSQENAPVGVWTGEALSGQSQEARLTLELFRGKGQRRPAGAFELEGASGRRKIRLVFPDDLHVLKPNDFIPAPGGPASNSKE